MRNCTVAESLHISTLPRDRRGAISQHSSRPSYGIEIFQDVPAEAEAGGGARNFYKNGGPPRKIEGKNQKRFKTLGGTSRKVGVKALLH